MMVNRLYVLKLILAIFPMILKMMLMKSTELYSFDLVRNSGRLIARSFFI